MNAASSDKPLRLPTAELEGRMQCQAAAASLRRAIYAYECWGHGSQVTQPLREALDLVEHSLREVQS